MNHQASQPYLHEHKDTVFNKMNTFGEVVNLALDCMTHGTHGLAHRGVMLNTHQRGEAAELDCCLRENEEGNILLCTHFVCVAYAFG